MENRELNQAAFDKVVRHLRMQGAQSLLPNGSCAYRGEGGAACAVGCLIPDAEYKEHFENTPVGYFAREVPALKGLNTSLLDDLRDVHDTGYPTDWERRLARVASMWGLTMPELEEP